MLSTTRVLQVRWKATHTAVKLPTWHSEALEDLAQVRLASAVRRAQRVSSTPDCGQ